VVIDYKVFVTKKFEDDIKYYKKKKHYNKIDDDINDVINELRHGNLVGDEIIELKLPEEESVFKVRATNTSIHEGKSNGFRLIYYVIKNEFEIYMLTIYSKKDKEDIAQEEISRLIKLYVNDSTFAPRNL
jgi:mRNA-degrading endonuclease RelE of RelBE toxin-antitoxin system